MGNYSVDLPHVFGKHNHIVFTPAFLAVRIVDLAVWMLLLTIMVWPR